MSPPTPFERRIRKAAQTITEDVNAQGVKESTQGPWLLLKGTYDDGKYLKIVPANASDPFYILVSNNSGMNNARLIAQAPALVKALRHCLEAFDNMGQHLPLETCEAVAPLMEHVYDEACTLLRQIEKD